MQHYDHYSGYFGNVGMRNFHLLQHGKVMPFTATNGAGRIQIYFNKYHPDYLGNVGMRRFHLLQHGKGMPTTANISNGAGRVQIYFDKYRPD